MTPCSMTSESGPPRHATTRVPAASPSATMRGVVMPVVGTTSARADAQQGPLRLGRTSADELHGVVEAELVDESDERRRLRSVPHDHDARTRHELPHAHEGAQRDPDPVTPLEVGHHQHVPARERRLRDRSLAEARRVDAHGLHARRHRPAQHVFEAVARVGGRGEDAVGPLLDVAGEAAPEAESVQRLARVQAQQKPEPRLAPARERRGDPLQQHAVCVHRLDATVRHDPADRASLRPREGEGLPGAQPEAPQVVMGQGLGVFAPSALRRTEREALDLDVAQSLERMLAARRRCEHDHLRIAARAPDTDHGHPARSPRRRRPRTRRRRRAGGDRSRGSRSEEGPRAASRQGIAGAPLRAQISIPVAWSRFWKPARRRIARAGSIVGPLRRHTAATS